MSTTTDEKPARATVLTREDAMQLLCTRNHLALGHIGAAVCELEAFADPAMTKINPWGWIETLAGGTAADFAPPAHRMAPSLDDFAEPSELDIEHQMQPSATPRLGALQELMRRCREEGHTVCYQDLVALATTAPLTQKPRNIVMTAPNSQAVEAAEREKFEKAVRLGVIPHVPAHITWKNDECGKGYAQHFAQCAWSAWQARAAITSQEVSAPAGGKRLIGWRSADYTMETADRDMAENWSHNVDVLPIFEGDPNTRLAASHSPVAAEQAPAVAGVDADATRTGDRCECGRAFASCKICLGQMPRHKFWGAGEPDCPPDIKASNGELHTMRCKVCGDGWRENIDVCLANPTPEQGRADVGAGK